MSSITGKNKLSTSFFISMILEGYVCCHYCLNLNKTKKNWWFIGNFPLQIRIIKTKLVTCLYNLNFLFFKKTVTKPSGHWWLSSWMTLKEPKASTTSSATTPLNDLERTLSKTSSATTPLDDLERTLSRPPRDKMAALRMAWAQ